MAPQKPSFALLSQMRIVRDLSPWTISMIKHTSKTLVSVWRTVLWYFGTSKYNSNIPDQYYYDLRKLTRTMTLASLPQFTPQTKNQTNLLFESTIVSSFSLAVNSYILTHQLIQNSILSQLCCDLNDTSQHRHIRQMC